MFGSAAAIKPTAGRPGLPFRRRSGRETAPESPGDERCIAAASGAAES